MPTQRLLLFRGIQIALCAALQLPTFGATAQSPLQQGIASYNSGNYPAAISFLQEHIAKNPKDATAHYYLANAFFKIRQVDEAGVEYRKAFESSPTNSQLRQYCIVALQKMAPSANSATGGGGGKRSALNPDSEVAKTLARIDHQALLVKRNKDAAAESNANFAANRGKFDESKLLSERNAKVNQLLQPDMYDIHGRAIYLDHSAEIEAIKRDYEERIKMAKISAEQYAITEKQKAAADASKVSSDVENLRSQLTDTRHLKDSAVLRAPGTNMYTRQYGDPRSVAARKPDAEVDEMLASPHRMILDSHSKPGTTKYRTTQEPLTAEQDKLQNSQSTDLKVKGTLIRK